MLDCLYRIGGEAGAIIRTGGGVLDKLGMKHPGQTERAVRVEEAGDDCSEASLRRITGEEDLRDVRHLVLAVDTNTTQVDHLGTVLPLLTELRLERGSVLASFRDLGSSLPNLRVLWLSACGVCHLDGVGALTGLEELYLAFNDVEDLTSIALHDRLEVLDLESNCVKDAEQAIHLGTCSRLWSLTLTANPVCRDLHYRRRMVEAVPQLASLDEKDVSDDDRRPPPTSSEEEEEDDYQNHIESCRPSKKPSIPPCHKVVLATLGEQPPNSNVSGNLTAVAPLPVAWHEGGQNVQELGSKETPIAKNGTNQAGTMLATANAYAAPGSGNRFTVTAEGSSGQRSLLHDQSREGCGEVAFGGAATSTTWGQRDAFSLGRAHLFLPAKQNINRGEMASGGRRETSVAGGYEALSCSTEVGAGDELEATREGSRRIPILESAAERVVGEEEMVAKAIKNFRLLRRSSSPGHGPNEAQRTSSNRSCPCREEGRGGSATARATISGNTSGEPGENGPPSQRPNNCEEKEGNKEAAGGANARALTERETDDIGEGEAGSGERDIFEGNDWLLKELSLQDMRVSATSINKQSMSEGQNDAASVLTHGSEVSFAGNPAFGLRRRRTPEDYGDTLASPSAVSTLVAPGTEKNHSPCLALVASDEMREAERQPMAAAENSMGSRVTGEDLFCGSLSEMRCTAPHRREARLADRSQELEARGGGKHEGFRLATGSVLASPMSRHSTRHPTSVDAGRPVSEVAPLLCPALLSPRSCLRRPRVICVQGRPTVDANEMGSTRSREKECVEDSRPCASPSPLTVVAHRTGGNAARRRRGGHGSKEAGHTHFHSRSAASLPASGGTGAATGCTTSQDKRLEPSASSRADGETPFLASYRGGFREGTMSAGDRQRHPQHEEGSPELDDGRCDWRQEEGSSGSSSSRGTTEVPEWSPTTFTARADGDNDEKSDSRADSAASSGRHCACGDRVGQRNENCSKTFGPYRPTASEISSRVMKGFQDAGEAGSRKTGTPWCLSAEMSCGFRGGRKTKSRRDRHQLRAQQKDGRTLDREGLNGESSSPVTTRGSRRECLTKTSSVHALLQKRLPEQMIGLGGEKRKDDDGRERDRTREKTYWRVMRA
ncbi:unnamed protein product [Ectocarpus sp. 4 AP-2014]